MHPSRPFHWTDHDEMLDFVRQVSFATLVSAGGGEPGAAHVPLLVTPGGALRFHLARANRIASGLDGARVLVSVLGPHGYVSPDWYGNADQVPTWNYVAVEAVGTARRLDPPAAAALLDSLSADQEARLAPKAPWTSAKMKPGLFEQLAKAIVAFELVPDTLRGTRKLGQNKSAAERAGAGRGLREAGRGDIAGLMEGHEG